MKSDESKVFERAKKVKLILLDVDGVLTDGSVIYSGKGEELKVFDVKDGLGIKLAQAAGLKVGILSGRASPALETRAKDLQLDVFYQGQRQKIVSYDLIKEQFDLRDSEIAYIGDDLNDLPVMEKVGFKITINDAVDEIKEMADYVTKKNGGKGAVREAVELILRAQNKLEVAVTNFLK